ncbi:MAG: hypothetical protein DI564_06335 [Rhodanobacter denitrificans]|uniref:Thymidylate kinase n=1 Tax=Rhodanobacter denitrificans TaxID=666685 RepID=A0A2W5KPL4_9GAMM|nr:MAG: hypothetical protein DI564_06335 [Rhodanobacter denitrificans]
MIVVIEGISAAGKTAWCRRHAADRCVPETGPIAGAPDRDADPHAAARFWAAANARRWQAALALERTSGYAVCDTDPLKLHYVWSLWRIGAATEAQWRAECAAAREQIAARRLGFADRYYVRAIDTDQARRQRDGDPTRTRRNFDLHLRLQAPLMAWYETLARVLPGRVQFDWPDAGELEADSAAAPDPLRYALDRFDALVAALPVAAVG